MKSLRFKPKCGHTVITYIVDLEAGPSKSTYEVTLPPKEKVVRVSGSPTQIEKASF
jgi:hypothetical protein